MKAKTIDTFSINTDALMSTTVPTTTRSKSNITKAINCFKELTMPKNFSKTSELNNVINILKQVEENVNGIIDYINKEIEKSEENEKNAQEIAASLNWALSYQGGGLPNVGYSGYGTVVTNPQGVLEQLKNAGITVPGIYPTFLNLEVAASKGLVQLGESIVDGTLSTLAEKASVLNWMFNSPINKKNMEKMQKATMSFVSKDYTKNLYDFLYSDKFKIGKKIDDNSFIKKDSNISNFVTDITSGGALFKFAEAAGPYGKIATTALGFLKGKGESAQTYWSQSDVKSQIENGKNISTIFKKGSIYSDVKGLWSAVSTTFQAATGAGGKVDSVLNAPWKRVLADSAMGGADVLIDTITGVVVDKKNVKQAFKDAGGLEAIGYKALTAGAISSVGELARWGIGKVGGRKNNTTTIKETTIDNVDELTKPEAKFTEINFNKDVPGVVRKEHLAEIEQNVYSASDERFMEIAKKTGSYGMDQDVTHEFFYFVDSNGKEIRQGTKAFSDAIRNGTDMEIKYTPEYQQLKDYLTNSSFKMSKDDAERTLSMINAEIGVCSYTATHNNLVQIYGKNSKDFTNATGLDLSKSNVDDAKKLVETYIYRNHEENYGKIFREVNGRTEIIPSAITSHESNLAWSKHLEAVSAYNSNMKLFDERGINSYISANYGTKEIKRNTSKDISFGNMSEKEYTKHMIDLQDYLKDDNKGIMLTLRDKTVPIIRKIDGNWGGLAVNKHSVTITGVTKQGIIVSDWGKRDFISHKSLIDSDAMIYVISEKGQ